jgi:hypothetical protein
MQLDYPSAVELRADFAAGRRFADVTVLRVAALMEQALPCGQRRPTA